ncbi:glutathione S-transferase C-terminal domain-containing protein [Paraburkholderia sp. EG287A]|uniref:glutathione S-transferase C-terminal domain-containing protein n=1 Tax=unclassified Paraburkholderia TaxID=2615204 RepID=UPI0034D200C3
MEAGFAVLAERLSKSGATGAFCYGGRPTLADLCLVPQVFDAHRFEIDTSRYPTIQEIYDVEMQHAAFAAAAPGCQPDAE